jgi:hypothetical protein
MSNIIWLLLVIWIVGSVGMANRSNRVLEEGFTSSMDACRDQGYTKEFCSTQPSPNQCITPSGIIGVKSRAFKGQCVVHEELEDSLVGIGASSRDPSIADSYRNQLKWKDNTVGMDIETGPRYGYAVYTTGEITDDDNIVRPSNWYGLV